MTGLSDLRPGDLVADPIGSARVVIDSAMRNLGGEWHFYAVLAAAVILVAVVDIFQRRAALAKYGRRSARTDMLYGLVELSHVQAMIVVAPLAASLNGVVDSHVPWLRLGEIAQLPTWAVLVVGLVAADFWGYWIHRFKHENRWLWQFHKVHHSQEHLTVLTFFRDPILERLLNFMLVFPLGVLTGSAELPLALLLIKLCRSMLEHSGLDWDYGPLGRVIVSPVFHGVHHSRAEAHINKNYGNVFSFWDPLFGTQAERGSEPLKYGLAHETITECFWRQNAAPVVGLCKLARQRWSLGKQINTATAQEPAGQS